MLMDVETFRRRVRSDLVELVAELQEETGRTNPDEAWAWEGSLRRLADVLQHEALKSFHLHLGHRGSISLEYRLPASASFVDAALLGRSTERPAAALIELKDWDTSGDAPGPRPGLIRHQGVPRLHPSEQVRGYVEYCRAFHSAVLETGARVDGCAFMTGSAAARPYRMPPHEELAQRYPVFTISQPDLRQHFPAYLSDILASPAPDFAEQFEHGSYRQDRSFVVQVARAIQEPASTPFVLLDRQREGFEHCLEAVDRVLGDASTGQKAVVLVEGPPGSGKSVLAAQLWAHLVQDPRIEGSVVLTTTSASQRSNWEHLFENVASGPAGRGLVMPANRYNPGLSPRWVGQQREQNRRVEIENWRANVELYLAESGRNRCPDDSFDVSIVDEAHALIDPTLPGKRGIPPSGWALHAGPQAWHIMRASRLSVFLLDGDQSYRDNETTTPKRIEELAADLGISQVLRVSLADAQFRCGGSAEYMRWLDAFLELGAGRPDHTRWRSSRGGPFHFELVAHPGELDSRLTAQIERGYSARLVSSYSRKWVTREASSPWSLPAEQQDFFISYEEGGLPKSWYRPWNHTPAGDYAPFVQAPDGTMMARDALAEVGCPYVVRGFDYDYLGVLWLGDLLWRGHWVADLSQIHETAWSKTLKAARKEAGAGPATEELVRRLLRGYRILLSRAIRGIFLWVQDPETREHVEAELER